MQNEQIEIALHLCLAVCAQDGFISEVEEETLATNFKKEFNLGRDEFNQFVDNFFESDDSVDSYIDRLSDDYINSKIIEFSKQAASSDGLDIRENIAFQKVKLFLGADNE